MRVIDSPWSLLSSRHVEQRRHVRFRFTAPVTFSWRVGEAEYHGSGITRDVSSHGIFVFCDPVRLPTDFRINLEVSLSSPDAPKTLTLKATGHVVRIERNSKTSGFAAAATFKLLTTSTKSQFGNDVLTYLMFTGLNSLF